MHEDIIKKWNGNYYYPLSAGQIFLRIILTTLVLIASFTIFMIIALAATKSFGLILTCLKYAELGTIGICFLELFMFGIVELIKYIWD